MKINDNFSNKNDLNYLNNFDFSKNDSFGTPTQKRNSNNIKEYSNNINQENVDPRLELTLNYLDINSILPTFITNNISFNDLLLLSKNDLIELGFSLVERNRIIHFSQEFKRYGKKYNIQEIHNFFNEFQNLNMRLNSINNNIQYFPYQKENEINNISINNNKNNKKNYNNNNYTNKNIKNYNYNKYKTPTTTDLYLNEKKFQINNNINNDFFSKKSNSSINSNNIQINKNNNDYNNNIKVMNNYISANKAKNKNNLKDPIYQNSLNSNLNYNHNNLIEINSSKLVRQNSKASKNSSYSKNSKSKLVTMSKSFLPPATSFGSIVQKYQNLSEEIDNYFKKYNEYKEQQKNKIKKYQIITTSNSKKKNYNPIFFNNYNNKNYFGNKNKENYYINNINNHNNVNNINDKNNLNNFIFNDNNKEEKLNNELSLKLQELEKKKKELKEKLNLVCEKENKKKMIIQYLEEEEK